MPEYLPLLMAVITIIGALGGFNRYLHGLRTKTLADARSAQEADRKTVGDTLKKLDDDIDGLAKQIGADALDHERRFVSKPDHERDMGEIKHGLIELGRKIDDRFYRRGPHDPAC